MFCVFSVQSMLFVFYPFTAALVTNKRRSQIRSILYKLDRDHFQKNPLHGRNIVPLKARNLPRLSLKQT